ncbi:RNA polymerase sporulation sigma factor SigK [Mahella australiensis]|jgi:RNA polymerase sporulation-specific sigma factor|uniref:RNA polymerase sigma factor n=1 Tax=Mahella australiensis (strain DSM 15567 / CIP 107919 / 50-1 BON) TaxID=697281 RepID=F4A371_MAHA5|nr:RNA polymerase sporulation sigma factor SigK [Mahella australiensis]AEE96304.1 RNA polymerase, sigma 27/28 subunit, RpsK/SigK [Mahella australiensis 50-1 BON]MDK2902697.1 polymerase sporulation-specific sigma factor [Clostridiales bacterium]
MLLSIIGGVILSLKEILLLTSYVSNNNSFPQPLSYEEERHYLELYEQGDQQAKNILIEHNLRLVAHIVKKYNNAVKDPEDLISIGTIGLIKGITTFDSNKGTRLATYAARCIENEILMYVRASKKEKKEVFLQEPIGTDKEGNEVTLIDILGTDEDTITDQVSDKMQIAKLYKKMGSVLKDRERLILELRYGLINGNDKTQREIAQMLGISRSYVSRIEKKALNKLNKELQTEGCH